jgi:natural resistance-associated macrophage protein 2
MAVGLLVPSVPKGSFKAMVGLIGAVIMPHNLYLHSALVLSRKVNYRNRNAVNEGNYYNAIESAISLGISVFINVFVISTFAIYVINNKDSKEDNELNLSSAAKALEGKLGTSAKYIWAIGLLAAGQAATMTGTYAG